MDPIEKLKVSRNREQQLEQLSPFELKDSLISLASEQQQAAVRTMLNAGRGNPNWTATVPREAFFTLGKFGLEECKRAMAYPSGLGGIPRKKDIAKRFEQFLKDNPDTPGIALLEQTYKYGLEKHAFVADDFILELTEGIIGDQYPSPGRILKHTEIIVHDYLQQEMCGGSPRHKGAYDLFAVEGGTAAMCYIFDSLFHNGLLKKGDKIALAVPTFTPYLEIPELERYNFKITYIHGSAKDKEGRNTFQYPDEELDKLGDRSVKALFIINPSNPTSVQLSEKSRKYLVKVVKNLNPNLMIITDDVYGTFVNGFKSLMDELPQNTLCVYSFSKYFGATGWRLGVIALHENNVYDDMLSAIPEKEKERLAKMYESLTLKPGKMKFIDRLLADSRQVALNHTAGLSLPQQIQMLLFSAFALLDKQNNYKNDCNAIIQRRYNLLWEGMGVPVIPDPDRAGYYCEIDILEGAIKHHGKGFGEFLKKNFEPVDFLFRLAELSSVVLLNGGGFAGPEWSVRVSLANLEDSDYSIIGRKIAETMQEYVDAWKNTTK
jgi:aspartate 4-decarboxylase